MRGGQIVTSPDGDRWQVKRRWTNRPMPSLRRRFQEGRDEGTDTGVVIESVNFNVLDFENPWWAAAVLVVAFVLSFVLLPLIGVALELILIFLVLTSGVLGRVLLRRPWIVEANNLDNPGRSATFPVKGWRRSGEAIEELARRIAAGQTPLDKDAGSPNSSAIRTTEDAV